MIRDNKVTEFNPKRLQITSKYEGYTGDNWGHVTGGRSGSGGYPFRVKYTDNDNSKESDWVEHYKLFPSKEELLKSL